MIKPDFQTHDEALEFAAQLVEQMSIRELAGIWAKRKRDREDAALRGEAIRETKAEMAKLIRAFKDRPDLSPITALREISALGSDNPSSSHLRNAWQLAAKGWVKVLVTVDCTGNSVPPETRYRIEVTERGRDELARAALLKEASVTDDLIAYRPVEEEDVKLMWPHGTPKHPGKE